MTLPPMARWDGCRNSPGSAPEALTVGSTDEDDARATSSNHGPCVNVFAPGVLIQAAHRSSESWLSGTSMAAPHVAGVAAIALSADPRLTPSQLRAKIIGDATDGVLSDIPVHGLISEPAPPPPPPI
jgi:subtilisin family serine protease